MVYPQIFPVSIVPKLVRSPDRVKYCPQCYFSRFVSSGMLTYQGQEENCNQIFNLLHKRDSKSVLTRDDQSGKETA